MVICLYTVKWLYILFANELFLYNYIFQNLELIGSNTIQYYYCLHCKIVSNIDIYHL